MRIQSITTQKVYDIDLRKQGENAMACPECSATRKHPKLKSFSYNTEKNAGFCHNCQTRFVEYRNRIDGKQYIVPEWKNITELTDHAVKWFTGRGISQRVLNEMKVYSDKHYFPQAEKELECICFPYFRDGKLINIKYRGTQKSFSVVKDAELIFWNIDCIIDQRDVIIVEGEIDLLSCLECGLTNVVSVPNGASNFDFLDNSIEIFDNIDRVILCVDQDSAGIKLRNELIRRIGSDRCYLVNLAEYKDANDYLQNRGGYELKERIKAAEPIPVSGIITPNEAECYALYKDGIKPGLSLNIPELDSLVTWEPGRLAVVTGIPKHGKSGFVDFIVSRMNIIHSWKVAFFSPENFPVAIHFRKLVQIIGGRSCDPAYLKECEFSELYTYITDNFFWIYPDDNWTIDSILEKALYLVKTRGIKQLVLDPWNRIESTKPVGISETEYTGRILDKIDNFGKRNELLIYIVAHTTKMPSEDNGQYKKPNMYDISGSANWYNKCDYGVVVYRNFNTGTTTIDVPAVKFDHLGDGGSATFVFNYINKRFETIQDVNVWSKNNWLTTITDNVNNVSIEELPMPEQRDDQPF